jgi:hypothetical protein
MAAGVVVPTGGAELSNGLDGGRRRKVASSTDLGRLGPAGVANDVDVGGLDELERHGEGTLT